MVSKRWMHLNFVWIVSLRLWIWKKAPLILMLLMNIWAEYQVFISQSEPIFILSRWRAETDVQFQHLTLYRTNIPVSHFTAFWSLSLCIICLQVDLFILSNYLFPPNILRLLALYPNSFVSEIKAINTDEAAKLVLPFWRGESTLLDIYSHLMKLSQTLEKNICEHKTHIKWNKMSPSCWNIRNSGKQMKNSWRGLGIDWSEWIRGCPLCFLINRPINYNGVETWMRLEVSHLFRCRIWMRKNNMLHNYGEKLL